MDIRKFEEEHGLKPKDIINVARDIYPKYDKVIHCHVKNPEQYGVRWVDDLERAVIEAFSDKPPVPRKQEHRSKPYRMQVRLSKRSYEILQRRFEADGFDTVQAGLAFIIGRYIKEEEA